MWAWYVRLLDDGLTGAANSVDRLRSNFATSVAPVAKQAVVRCSVLKIAHGFINIY